MIEWHAGLQSELLKSREGIALLIAVILLGEALVGEDEADPAQKIDALELAWPPDVFHPWVCRIFSLDDRNVLSAHALAAGRLPRAERHHGDAILDAVHELQLLGRIIGERDAPQDASEVRGRL